MDRIPVIENMSAVLEAPFALPTITYWNRLESRPRADNFERALRAEVRDPLWMLCKQWQMGEFQGDDAGSPAQAKVQLAFTPLTKYRPDSQAASAFDRNTPLEAQVERRPIPLQSGTQDISLDIRLLAGRRWKQMLRKAHTAAAFSRNLEPEFLTQFNIATPNAADETQAALIAHSEAWQQWSAVADRAIDGGALLQKLAGPEAGWFDFLAGLSASDVSRLTDLGQSFKAWFAQQYFQPENAADHAWNAERLTYEAACSAPKTARTEKVYVADDYHEGRLDWYNFDVDTSQRFLGDSPDDPAATSTQTLKFLPTPVSFNGMPNTRWWTFEDGKTNFGDIQPDTSDLSKLLLIEFGLVYANDWFLLPYTVPVGSVIEVKGMAVTNVFGERFWIEASGKGQDESWQQWRMFSQSVKGHANTPADNSLLLLPSAPKVQEGKPLEEIMLIRDEIANMVWGIETVVPLPSGLGKPGKEAASETRRYFKKRYENKVPLTPPPPPNADIQYKLMTEVPENWIPFVPVQIKKSNAFDVREIQLQRSSMLRIYPGMEAPYARIKPRTALLREGLDPLPGNDKKPYFVAEEEVPRAGVRVAQSFQRTRWLDGRVFTWLGVRKQTGRGEGSSGLAFDQVLPVKSGG